MIPIVGSILLLYDIANPTTGPKLQLYLGSNLVSLINELYTKALNTEAMSIPPAPHIIPDETLSYGLLSIINNWMHSIVTITGIITTKDNLIKYFRTFFI